MIFEPKDDTINVTIESPELSGDAWMYYIPEAGKAEVINSTSEDGRITIDADHFSVYAAAVVNEAVVVKMFSEDETVDTGKNHQVTIKASYSATNDGDKATVRIYMQDADGNMNTTAEVLGLVDDSIVYASENNEKLSITLTHGYEYDSEDNPVAEYLEYVLPAGTSVEMELEFYVPTGIYGPTETLVLVPEVTHEVGDGSNDVISSDLALNWISDFLWEDLQKTANVSEVEISENSILSEDIVYSYSDIMNPDTNGVIWTDSIEITETITLPDGLTFADGLTLGNDGIYLDTECLISVYLPQSFDYTLSDYDINDDKDQISFNITVENSNRDSDGVLIADFDAMKALTITLKGNTNASLMNLGAINLDENNIITNEVVVEYVPYENRTDAITLSSECEVNITYEDEHSTATKTANTTSTKEGSTVTYSATIENNTSESIDYEFYDIMDNGIGLSEAEREALIEQGYTVGYVDLLYSDEDADCVIGDSSQRIFEDSSDYLEVTDGLNEGAFVLVNLEIEDDGKYQSGEYYLTGYILTVNENWDWDNTHYYQTTKNISFADTEVVDGKRIVTVKLDFTDIDAADLSSCNIVDLGFSVVKSSDVENDSSVTVTKVLLYNGVEEASTDAELTTDAGTALFTHTPDSSVYSNVLQTTSGAYLYSIDDIDFNLSKSDEYYWWDAREIYSLYPEIYSIPDADDAEITIDIRNLRGASKSFNDLILYVWMMDYDWNWYQTQTVIGYLGNYGLDNSNLVTLAIPDGFLDMNGISVIGLQVVGSGASGTYDLAIGDLTITLYSNTSKKCCNYIGGTITVDAGDSKTISYTATSYTNEDIVLENDFYAGGNELVSSSVNVTNAEQEKVVTTYASLSMTNELVQREILTPDQDTGMMLAYGTETKDLVDAYKSYYTSQYSAQLVYAGYKSAEELAESSINCMSEGALLFYNISVTNDSDFAQEITIEEYSPLYYNRNNELYESGKHYVTDYGNKMSLVGTGTQYSYKVLSKYLNTDIYDSGYTESYSNKVYYITFTIPAHTTYTQTVLFQMLSGTEFAQWESEIWNLYGSTTDGDTPVFTPTTNYYPGNTVKISNTTLSTNTIKHTFENRVQINAYALGEFDSDREFTVSGSGSSYSVKDADGTIFDAQINYNTTDIYNVSADTDTYLVYGITIVNDSIDNMMLGLYDVNVTLPSFLEVIGFVSPITAKSWSAATNSSGKQETTTYNDLLYRNEDYSVSLGSPTNSQNLSGIFKSLYSEGNSNLFGITYDYGYAYNLYADPATYMTLRSSGATYGGSIVTSGDGSSFTYSLGTETQLLHSKSQSTVYVLCKVKDDYTGKISGTDKVDAYLTTTLPSTTVANGKRTASYADVYSTDAGIKATYNDEDTSSKSYESKLVGGSYTYSNVLGKSYYEIRTSATLYSRVTQNFTGTTAAMIYKSVVGKNTVEAMENGTATLTLYNQDLYTMSTSSDECITFMLAIANDSDVSKTFTVSDTYSSKLELLGFNYLTGDYTTSTVTAYYKVEGWENLYVPSTYYLTIDEDNTSTFDAQDYYLSTPVESLLDSWEQGYGLDVPNEAWVTWSLEEGFMYSRWQANDSTIDSYEADTDSFNFSVTIDANSVVYVFYTCKVKDGESLEDGEQVTNAVKLSTSSKLTAFESMMSQPFYDSNFFTKYVNGENQNICKGILTDGTGYNNWVNEAINTNADDQESADYIEAEVTLTAKSNKSVSIEKTVYATYDADDETTSYPGISGLGLDGDISSSKYEYIENDDTTAIYPGTISDSTSSLGSLYNRMLNAGLTDEDDALKYYSVIDGIHATNDYMSTVIWEVDIENTGDTSIDASTIIEKIDQPYNLLGYYIEVYNDAGRMVTSWLTSNYGEPMEVTYTEDASYTSKVTGETVTRNVYVINLEEDTPDSYHMQYSNLPSGWSYKIYFITDMEYEKLDWYYNTTYLAADTGDGWNLSGCDMDGYDEEGFYSNDWVSVIATDGVKYIGKDTDDEVSSKSSTVYTVDGYGSIVDFTLQMKSYLYQTTGYTDAGLENIIMYDLLPGTTGGYETDEPGGGYTVNTDSFEIYILRTDGTKEDLDESQYIIYYTEDALHGGRHPMATNDTAYNVDFAAASAESIWHTEYSQDDRAFKIVFDNSVVLYDADMLIVNYSATIRGDASTDIEYHNIMGYSYDVNNYADTSKNVHLYEDTVDVTVDVDLSDLYITKMLYDENGYRILQSPYDIDDYEYAFTIYDNQDNELFTFTLKNGDLLKLADLFSDNGCTYELNTTYTIIEDTSKYTLIVDGSAELKEASEGIAFSSSTDTDQVIATVNTGDASDAGNILFKNVVGSSSVTVTKYDQDGNIAIIDGDTYIGYEVYTKDTGELVSFTEEVNENGETVYVYDEDGSVTLLKATSASIVLQYLPIGEYYIKEVSAPSNYELNETPVYFEITSIGYYTQEAITVSVTDEYSGELIVYINKKDTDENYIDGVTSFVLSETDGATSDDDTLWFTDLGISESGHGYALADASTAGAVNLLQTYQGKIYITGLSHRTNYYLMEVGPALGYIASNDSTTIYCYNTETVKSYDVFNEEGTFDYSAYKVSSLGTAFTTGDATFQLYEDEDCDAETLMYFTTDGHADIYEYIGTGGNVNDYNAVYTNVTSEIQLDETGKLSIINLPTYRYYKENGSWLCDTSPFYYLVETLSDDMAYIYDGTVFVISEQRSGNLINEVKAGVLTVSKVDSNGDVITSSEATFKIYYYDGTEKKYIGASATGQNGVYKYEKDTENSELTTYNGVLTVQYLRTDVEYYLEEVDAPDGYLVATNDTVFTLTEENLTTAKTIEVTNVHDNGNFTLTKVDSQGDTITSDTASFKVYDADKNLVMFTLNAGEYDYDAAGTVSTLTTTDGILYVNSLPLGTYTIVETDAPDGYLISDSMEITIEESNYYEDLEVMFTDYHASGDVMIVKLDTDGDLINSNSIVFQLYDSDGNLVKLYYTGEKTDDGRIYSTSGSGYQYSRLTSYGGKIYIEDLPVGSYYLKEVVAPSGYSLFLDEISFTITDENYFEALTVQVVDPEYTFGSEEYVSSSYQKIEEKDESDNYAYGYNGTLEDYANGNYNYIVVDSAEDIITFTLRVMNRSAKNFENVVIIDSLADIDDTGAVNLNQERGSEFTISLADNENFTVVMYDEDGNEVEVTSDQYTITYSDQTSYTDDDWDGTTTWDTSASSTTRSFRVAMDEDFVLPSGYTLQVTFDAEIQDNADPLEIAWNAFGYRYYVGSVELTPEPPKVGVKIPDSPHITKEVTDGASETDTYDFYVYEVADDGTETLVQTLSILPNVETELTPHRIINGVDNGGYIESGKTYKVVEAVSKTTTLIDVTGSDDSIKEMTFNFTYDPEDSVYAVFTNSQSYNGEVILTKTDSQSGKLLEGVKYELRSTDGTVYTVTGSSGVYVLDADSTVTELVTDENGQIHITGLPYGDYVLVETEALEGYALDEAENTFTINDDNFDLTDEVLTAIPEELAATNDKLGSITIVKYSTDGTTLLAGVTFLCESITEGIDYSETLTTDEAGTIVFDELMPGTYQITEISTVSGLQLLAEPIEVTIPLVLTSEEVAAYGSSINMVKADTVDNVSYFFDLTYHVTNSATLVMPTSGNISSLLPLFVAISLIAAGVVLLVISRKKKTADR